MSDNVTLQDQKDINAFRILRDTQIELTEEQKQLKAQLDLTTDAEDEMALAMGDSTYIVLGTRTTKFFLETSEDEAEEYLKQCQKSLKNQHSLVSKKLNAISKEKTALKAKLYKKFGNRIQLEE